MDCVTYREALSARMDGEHEPVPAERTDRHLASCAGCRSWQARVARVSRALRVRPATPVPDLSAAVLAVVVPPSGNRGWGPRTALIGVAGAQIGLALSQVFGGAPAGHGGVPVAGHLFNESTAWNLALGVGLLWAAFRPRVTSGLIPVLGGFLVLLTAYSAHDLVTGAVPVSRVVEHGLLVLGLGLLIVINRRCGDPAPRHGEALDDTVDGALDGVAGGARTAAVAEPEHTGDGMAGHGPLRPVGRHRAA